jgi:acyl carrier protein
LDDDFFDIGGDSLAAIQVAARLSEESDWEPALEDIFMCPTIRELALQVRGVGAREG